MVNIQNIGLRAVLIRPESSVSLGQCKDLVVVCVHYNEKCRIAIYCVWFGIRNYNVPYK